MEIKPAARRAPGQRLVSGGDGFACFNGFTAAEDGEGGDNTAGRGEHQPESGRSLVAGSVDQPGRGQRGESAEQGRGETERQRAAGGSHMGWNYIGECGNHRAVVDTEVEGEH